MDFFGILTCARYAFPPNSLKYCGPDKVLDLYGYFLEKPDQGLVEIIKDFQVLYPYLKLIAFENNIADPFERRVVEAYWLGNNLLNNISMKSFYYHLLNEQQLSKKIPQKDLKWLIGKIPQGAFPHHSFHVFNVFQRTGHQTVKHTLETMDACRIGWGRVIRVQGSRLNPEPETSSRYGAGVQGSYQRKENQNSIGLNPETANARREGSTPIEVITQPLVFKKGKPALGESVIKEIKTEYKNRQVSQLSKVGDWISFHWDFFCDILTPRQVVNLEKYTQLSLNLANQAL